MLVIFHIYSLLSKIYQINRSVAQSRLWMSKLWSWARTSWNTGLTIHGSHCLIYWFIITCNHSQWLCFLMRAGLTIIRILLLHKHVIFPAHVLIVIWICLLMLFKYFFLLEKTFWYDIMKNARGQKKSWLRPIVPCT